MKERFLLLAAACLLAPLGADAVPGTPPATSLVVELEAPSSLALQIRGLCAQGDGGGPKLDRRCRQDPLGDRGRARARW